MSFLCEICCVCKIKVGSGWGGNMGVSIWLPQFPEALKWYSLKGKGKKAKKHHDPQSPALHLVTLHRELGRYRWECPPTSFRPESQRWGGMNTEEMGMEQREGKVKTAMCPLTFEKTKRKGKIIYKASRKDVKTKGWVKGWQSSLKVSRFLPHFPTPFPRSLSIAWLWVPRRVVSFPFYWLVAGSSKCLDSLPKVF